MTRRALRVGIVAAVLVVTGCGGSPARTPPKSPTPAASPAPTTTPSTRPAGARPASGTSSRDSAATTSPRPTPRPAAPGVVIARPADVATTIDARRTALATAGRGIAADEVGYYVDILEARLRQTRTIGLVVTRTEQRLSVELTDRTLFEVGSAALTTEARRSLANLTTLLTQYDRTIVAVHAHQPASGTPAADQRLAEQRALAVAMQFVSGGVAIARVVAVGHSGGASTAPKAGEEEQVSNGRIVLWLDAVRR